MRKHRIICLAVYGDDCELCRNGKQIPEAGDDIVAHHIDGDHSNDSHANLMPVCKPHHRQLHHNLPAGQLTKEMRGLCAGIPDYMLTLPTSIANYLELRAEYYCPAWDCGKPVHAGLTPYWDQFTAYEVDDTPHYTCRECKVNVMRHHRNEGEMEWFVVDQS